MGRRSSDQSPRTYLDTGRPRSLQFVAGAKELAQEQRCWNFKYGLRRFLAFPRVSTGKGSHIWRRFPRGPSLKRWQACRSKRKEQLLLRGQQRLGWRSLPPRPWERPWPRRRSSRMPCAARRLVFRRVGLAAPWPRGGGGCGSLGHFSARRGSWLADCKLVADWVEFGGGCTVPRTLQGDLAALIGSVSRSVFEVGAARRSLLGRGEVRHLLSPCPLALRRHLHRCVHCEERFIHAGLDGLVPGSLWILAPVAVLANRVEVVRCAEYPQAATGGLSHDRW